MGFFYNLGYNVKIELDQISDGGIFLASGMPLHQLERRDIVNKYHLKNTLFDPQLYLIGLDPYQTPKMCSNLVSYPWFGSVNTPTYDSAQMNIQSWNTRVRNNIANHWRGSLSESEKEILDSIEKCIDLQIQLGCAVIILPSPLTIDYSSNYETELKWLDLGIDAYKRASINLPLYATVSLSDSCLRMIEPKNNSLIELILDSVSAREIDGVYIVIELSQEKNETRYIGNKKTILSAMELVYSFSKICELGVVTNFFGPYGLVLEALGSQVWCSDWYKSLVRLRLADKMGEGRTYPLYWSPKIGADIHMNGDFDRIVNSGNLDLVFSKNPASIGLYNAAIKGYSSSAVPGWRYAINNRMESINHYRYCLLESEKKIQNIAEAEKLNYISEWLYLAKTTVDLIIKILPKESFIRYEHVQAWQNAFSEFRSDHNI